MRLDLITPEDWVEFGKRYPAGYAFLFDASLISEREDLRHTRDEVRPLNGWEERRLEELEQWYQDVHSVKKEGV